MQFGVVGSMVQLEWGTEGDTLWRAGLLEKTGRDWHLGIEPTDLLRSLFDPMPELEQLYPVLVEFVLIFKFPNSPGFVDEREVSRRLGELGLTADGLARLTERVCRVVKPR